MYTVSALLSMSSLSGVEKGVARFYEFSPQAGDALAAQLPPIGKERCLDNDEL